MSDAAPDPDSGEAPRQSALRPAPILSGWRGAIAVGFATALIVFGLLVITGPFWAPAVAPLFGTPPTPASADATADRLAQLEAAQREDRQKIEQALAAAQKATADAPTLAQQLERRIAALESKPAPSSSDLAELRQKLSALENRPTSTASDLDTLQQRVRALEAKPPASPPELGEIREQLQQLTTANADLKQHLAAVERGEQAQSATDQTAAGLLLTLLQIREALDIGSPFAAEYEVLAALAKSQPDTASAAASLADAAKSGVATRAVLMERLRALSGEIATARPVPAEDDWGARAWAQLRGLITIRRIEGAGQSAPETAVGAAARALAAGDLPGAIAALDKLTGAAADAARPWLEMARQRLAAEEALHRVQTLVVARLGPAR